MLYQFVRCLLGLIAVLVRRDLGKDAELLVLRHENAVLRRQISRVRYTLWVPNWSSTSGDLGVFVDQPAEPVATSQATLGWRRRWW